MNPAGADIADEFRTQVRRTMTRPITAILLLTLCCSLTFAADAPPATRPSLTEAETQAGWKLLFDGQTTAGWRGLGMDEVPKDIWDVRDGCLHCSGGAKANDLVAVDKFENFEL